MNINSWKKTAEEFMQSRRDREQELYGHELSAEERDEMIRRADEEKAQIEAEAKQATAKAKAEKIYKANLNLIPTRYREVAKPGCQIWQKQIFDQLKGCDTDAVLFGENGRGKTFLAWALIHEAWKQGKTAFYTTCYKLLQDVKSCYSGVSAAELHDVLGFYSDLQDLLVIDEWDKIHWSQDDYVILSDIIGERYAWMKPTIVITNTPQEKLQENVGKAIFSRLGIGGKTFRLDGIDQRSIHGQ